MARFWNFRDTTRGIDRAKWETEEHATRGFQISEGKLGGNSLPQLLSTHKDTHPNTTYNIFNVEKMQPRKDWGGVFIHNTPIAKSLCVSLLQNLIYAVHLENSLSLGHILKSCVCSTVQQTHRQVLLVHFRYLYIYPECLTPRQQTGQQLRGSSYTSYSVQ